MITYHSTRVPQGAVRLGLSSLALAALTAVAVAQGASGGASGVPDTADGTGRSVQGPSSTGGGAVSQAGSPRGAAP